MTRLSYDTRDALNWLEANCSRLEAGVCDMARFARLVEAAVLKLRQDNEHVAADRLDDALAWTTGTPPGRAPDASRVRLAIRAARENAADPAPAPDAFLEQEYELRTDIGDVPGAE